MGRYRLGCDIGGTFTDFVLVDERTGRFHTAKVLTTPTDPSEAVELGIKQLQERIPNFLQETDYLIHGTTLVINSIIERKGARTGLITTRGFRDILEMRREIRYDIYDIGAEYPTPLVPRPLRVEVNERTSSDGSILTAINPDDAEQAIQKLVDAGVESIAVCLLHSYANPANERAIEEVAARKFPGLSLSLSADVFPEIKEFERTSTTVANAYVKPLVGRYIRRLEERLHAADYSGALYLMLSGGGVITPEVAISHPVRLIESGPVGGVLAATSFARRAGLEDLIVFDMGGTTAKGCLVASGQPMITTEYEVDRVHRFKKGSGTPLGVPTVDLIEIGAGGGSIAAPNDLNLLQVGPRSAGADPGPICYSRNGREPTVTDADLVLGYLNPDYFLGGRMSLDVDAARAGIDAAVGSKFGYSTIEAAWAIHEVVNENMASAIRMYVTERGGDLRKCVLVASGGAGPVHAARIANKLGVTRLLIPRAAGVFSALGFLVAPISFEVSRTVVRRLLDMNVGELAAIFDDLAESAAKIVRLAAPAEHVRFERSADLSYVGQGHSLRMAINNTRDMSAIREQFLEEYRRRYGVAYDDVEVQIVTPRVSAVSGSQPVEAFSPFETCESGPAYVPQVRPAYDPETRAMVPHLIYVMDKLASGMEIRGPAIIEDESSCIVLGGGARALVENGGWLDVTI